MDKILLTDHIAKYPTIFLKTNLRMAPETDTSGLEMNDHRFSIHYMNHKLQPGQEDLMGEPVSGMLNVPLINFPPPLSL